jgi:hypothetical protein
MVEIDIITINLLWHESYPLENEKSDLTLAQPSV